MEARMPRTLDDVIAALPKGERAKIEARARELVAEEMSLQDLRKAIGKTQTAIAKRLRVGQDAVSKLEARSDMYISTLRGFVRAMGGELELVARFPKRPPVRLEELGRGSPRRKRDRRAGEIAREL
jgi:transcriptional regulator with XRE-family HTH domain